MASATSFDPAWKCRLAAPEGAEGAISMWTCLDFSMRLERMSEVDHFWTGVCYVRARREWMVRKVCQEGVMYGGLCDEWVVLSEESVPVEVSVEAWRDPSVPSAVYRATVIAPSRELATAS